MTCVVDTSWLTALLMDGDLHHAKARSEAEREDAIFVPPAALVETTMVLREKAKALGLDARSIPREAVEKLGLQPTVVLAKPDHDHEHALRIWRAHPKLSYVDAAVIAAARAKGLTLRTFDRDQAKAHRALP